MDSQTWLNLEVQGIHNPSDSPRGDIWSLETDMPGLNKELDTSYVQQKPIWML